MSDSSSHPQTVYCAACNVRFPQRAESQHCPRCGAEVVERSESLLDATVLVKVDAKTETDWPRGDTAREVATFVHEDLSGRKLHVYECRSLLGEGGMGRVYLARHSVLGRPCALKILSPRLCDSDIDYVRRFLHEGRAAAGLIHPNIVTVHAIGEAEKFHYLEMEFVPGQSLQKVLDKEGPLNPIRATVLAAEIAQGLAAAHREGVVHRDLKADNILLNHQGIPKIADFGLAKRILDDDGVPSTRIVGTPHYMAPELFQGNASTVTSDVYALGVCYFQMMTGQFPFTGDSYRSMRQAVEAQPLPNVRDLVPDVSLEMAECLALLLEKTPENRPKSALEAVQLLQAVLGNLQDLESLLHEAFGGDTRVNWQRHGRRYDLHITFPDGRGQKVYVEATGRKAIDQIVSIYSLCCEHQADYCEQALRLNSEIPHGAIAIRDMEGRSFLIVVNNYPRSSITAEALRKSVLEVGTRADAIEKLLTGLDVH